MSATKTLQLRAAAEEYHRLVDRARALGIPISLDDPDSPRTVDGLSDAIDALLADVATAAARAGDDA